MPTGDHFYTTSATERDGAIAVHGYIDEGIACYVYSSQASGTIPLYRLFNPHNGDHFYTTSVTERDGAVANFGYTNEGIACYVFGSPASGTTPLYRLFNPHNGDHFYTTSVTERDGAVANFGYTNEGIACYAFGSQTSGTIPLYRLLKFAELRSFIRLHLKILTAPNIPIRTMVDSMRRVYTTARIRVDVIPFGLYNSEGIACYVFSFQPASTTPLYRLFNPSNGDHFYTTSAAERDGAVANFGYTSEGIACYVFGSSASGTTPLYRLFNPNNGDHFYTTSAAERDGAVANFGYTSEGIACYVFGSSASGTAPLYRLFNPHNGDHFYTTSEAEAYNAANAELLNLPLLTDLDAGRCVRGEVTQEQRDLFNNRTNVGTNDIAVYFVRSTNGASGPLNGCAVFPNGRPGCIVTRVASQWTLAHEVGHVLGLDHLTGENCGDPMYVPTRLMTGCGTGRITGLPTLSQNEMTTMDSSNLTINI
jgi:hypothetical protein